MLSDSLKSYQKIDETRRLEDIQKPLLIGTIIIMAFLLIPYLFIWGIGEFNFLFLLKLFFGYILFIIVHELLHMVGYVLFGKAKLSEVKLGVLWKQVTPYAHCKIPIQINAYRISVLLPVILGILPLIYAFSAGNNYWFFIGMFMTVGSLGDCIILWLLRNYTTEVSVQDHSSKIGCVVYTPQK